MPRHEANTIMEDKIERELSRINHCLTSDERIVLISILLDQLSVEDMIKLTLISM